MIKALITQLLKFFSTDVGFSILIGIIAIILLGYLYNRFKQIPGLEVKVIQEDTWFINRDDKNIISIVVSLNLENRSPQRIMFRKCKLSGYSPKENPPKLYLEVPNQNILIDYPKYTNVYSGMEYSVSPYSSDKIWLYYESRSITLKNLLRSSIVIKDFNRKRKTIMVQIPRHPQQLTIYYQEFVKQ